MYSRFQLFGIKCQELDRKVSLNLPDNWGSYFIGTEYAESMCPILINRNLLYIISKNKILISVPSDAASNENERRFLKFSYVYESGFLRDWKTCNWQGK